MDLPKAQTFTRTRALGLAIDFGVSTLGARLVALDSRRILAESRELNQLNCYGQDAAGRLAYGRRQGGERLRQTALAQLAALRQRLCLTAGVDPLQVGEAVVVGDSAGLHLLANYPPEDFPPAPGDAYPGLDIERQDILPGLTCYLPPGAAGACGPDLAAALLALDFAHPTENRLYLKIASEGYLALNTGGQIHCCTLPLGPVFEGLSLSKGLLPGPGAIYQAELRGEELLLRTFDGGAPLGLSGSGLVSLLALLLKAEALSNKGQLLKGHPLSANLENQPGGLVFRLPGTAVTLPRNDILQAQLAKAAIAAGLDLLLKSQNLFQPDLSQALVSGSVVPGLSLAAAKAIGLLPASLSVEPRLLENDALDGATLLLGNGQARADLRALASRCRSWEGTEDPGFQQAYLRRMTLEPMY